MIKILIGGSPCTYWSVAQKKGREVEAEGLGWELFRNYLIAKEKFKPDFFLYENNKSAAQPIKDQISHELGVDLMHINSALVSAQNRQRFYAFNWNVDQPADRGIMLKDILETATSEKGYELRAPAVGVGCRNRREDDGKLYRRFETSGIEKANALTTVQTDSMVAEPIRIGTIENSAKKQSHDSKQYRVYSPEGKATTLRGEGGGLGAKTGLYAAPVRVGTMPNADGEVTGGQAHRIYDASGKAVALCARPNGGGPEAGLYAYPAGEAQGAAWRGRDDGSAYYDGIGTGRYCLDKMGFTNVTYYAYEIDKPAMTVALSNYPNIIQLGDAFDLRRDDWELGKRFERTAEQKAEAPESPDQTTDLSDAPEEIKEQIIENDRALKEKDSTAPAPPPEGFDVVDQLSELLAERKKLHIIDEENLRYNCDIIALEYAIGALRR